MAESISIESGAPKELKYEQLIPQIKALVGEEKNMVAVLANVAAALHESFNFLWTGFYLVDGDELVLGPFQGPVACTRIAFGKGVCGTAWRDSLTQVVPDVDLFPGHIACSSQSKSEIVVPILRNEVVMAVLDIDSAQLACFDERDKNYLETLCNWIGDHCFS
ncbi:MAG: GAF domain-containing protein [Flavobacteriales bacterium]